MEKLKKQSVITGIITPLSGAVLVPVLSFLYGKSNGEIILNSIFALFYSLGLAYLFAYFYMAHKYDYDNNEHPYRFLVSYSVSLVVGLVLPLIDVSGWIILSIAVTISLFSNSIMGIYCGNGILMIACLLSPTPDTYVFFVYFVSSIIGIVLFQDIDQELDVVHSLFISIICQFVFEIAGFVLLKNEILSAEQFIIPVVNGVVNIIIIFWVIKYFNDKIANRYRNRYLELNDQEYKVLVELKSRSPRDYWCSIHTAYLVDRMSYAIGCDVNKSKSLAYYHRIKKAFSYSVSASDRFIIDNGFPPEAAEALRRYWNKNIKLTTKEEGIVFISDNMISSIQGIFIKDKQAKVDYEVLYDTLLNKDFVKNALSDSDLSVHDFKLIKEVVMKETLYYDFLR